MKAINLTAQELDAKLAALICRIVPVEKIYRLDTSLLEQMEVSTPTTTTSNPAEASQCLYLVLTGHTHHDTDYLQGKIEGICSRLTPVTAIVVRLHTFMGWQRNGHRFVTVVQEIATLLYQDSHTAQQQEAITAQQTEDPFWKCIHTSAYVQTANKFVACAEMFMEQQQNQMALFMLNHAIKHALHAILQHRIGLCVNTDNLHTLMRYGTAVAHQVNNALPRRTQKDRRLFHLVKVANINIRYGETIPIESKDVLTLLQRVKNLCQMADGLLMATAVL